MKGEAMDKSAGIVIETTGMVFASIRSTDLTVYYQQRVVLTSGHGPDVFWRVGADPLHAVASKLPMKSGAEVQLAVEETDPSILHLTTDTIRAKLNMFDGATGFPQWEWFDPEGMATVEGIADRLAQVEWAVHKTETVLSGVHIDGTHLWACNKDNLVRVPLACPVDHPVTAPIGNILSLVKAYPELNVRAGERKLEFMTDSDTQLSMGIFAEPWPNVRPFTEIETPHSVRLERSRVVDCLDRLLALAKVEQSPYAVVELLGDRMQMSVVVEDVGSMTEDIEVPDHEPFTFYVTAATLRAALAGARTPEVVLAHDGQPKRPLRLTDGAGYEAVVMPRSVRGRA